MVTVNGSGLAPDGSLSAAPSTQVTVGGAGNTPVGIAFPAGLNFVMYVITNETSNNVTALNLNLSFNSVGTAGGGGERRPIDGKRLRNPATLVRSQSPVRFRSPLQEACRTGVAIVNYR
jgi:hypothetical protein